MEPAYTFTKVRWKQANVCTSNKELVARDTDWSFWRLPEKRTSTIYLRPAGGGGIPHYPSSELFFDSGRDRRDFGILNGTTNYILTKMAEENADFEDVLKEAQGRGYAERNPEADGRLYDACRKIAILSSLAFGCPCGLRGHLYRRYYKDHRRGCKIRQRTGHEYQTVGNQQEGRRQILCHGKPGAGRPGQPALQCERCLSTPSLYTAMCWATLCFYGSGAGKLPLQARW